MSQDLDSLSLDELFREAKAALGKQRAKVAKGAAHAPAKDAPSVPSYYDLTNWTKTRGVALIHQETHTVIGNFTEYTHKVLPGARRLVREVEVLPFTTVEYVTGVWGAIPEAPIKTPRLWNAARLCTLAVRLKELKVSAEAVPLNVSFGEGVLESVQLVLDTTFQSAQASPEQSFCILPAGTNILPVLSQSTLHSLLINLGQPI